MLTADLAVTVGQYAALERRLFEILGGWATAVEDPEVQVALRVQSFRHAWHAELWDGLAPLAVPPPDDPPPAPVDLSPLTASGPEDGSGRVRLDAWYGSVLPALISAYEALVASAAVASGGPLRRAVGLMLADDRTFLAEPGLV